jgi:hypothetical protein
VTTNAFTYSKRFRVILADTPMMSESEQVFAGRNTQFGHAITHAHAQDLLLALSAEAYAVEHTDPERSRTIARRLIQLAEALSLYHADHPDQIGVVR